MAASIQIRETRRRGRGRVMAEINVTPFVDVMLVLLIVFMVTAPLLTVGVPVDLPKTHAQPLGQQNEPLSVTIKRDGRIYLQNTPIDEADLVPRLWALLAKHGVRSSVPHAVAPSGTLFITQNLHTGGPARSVVSTKVPSPSL